MHTHNRSIGMSRWCSPFTLSPSSSECRVLFIVRSPAKRSILRVLSNSILLALISLRIRFLCYCNDMERSQLYGFYINIVDKEPKIKVSLLHRRNRIDCPHWKVERSTFIAYNNWLHFIDNLYGTLFSSFLRLAHSDINNNFDT